MFLVFLETVLRTSFQDTSEDRRKDRPGDCFSRSAKVKSESCLSIRTKFCGIRFRTLFQILCVPNSRSRSLSFGRINIINSQI